MRRFHAGFAISAESRGIILVIELTDEQSRALAESPKQLQVSEAELAVAAAVRGLVSAPAADFADAAKRVLRKKRRALSPTGVMRW